MTQGSYMTRKAWGVAAIVTLSIGVTAGCSGEGGADISTPATGSTGSSNAEKLPATRRVSMFGDSPLTITLLALNRVSAETLVAQFRLNDNSGQGYELDSNSELLPGDDWPKALTSLTFVDTENHNQYFPLRSGSHECLCTQFGSSQEAQIPGGGSLTAYAYFPAPPANVHQVTVLFPSTAPFVGVPLDKGNSASRIIPRGQPDLRPTQVAKVAAPKIEPIVARQQSLDGASQVEEKPQKTEVRLSTDVLFDLNDATLRPKARPVLEKIAKRIERSGTKVVSIDGYTDSTGGPRINKPLSENRAKSVAKALRAKVPRTGVRFDTHGHAAEDPVASNSTKEGRQQNRRVTVTFNS